jgi:peptidoglycan/LPS O-acetylase OafA/YrhL
VYAFAQLGPVIAVSYVVYYCVERPSLRWVESFSSRARAGRQASPT